MGTVAGGGNGARGSQTERGFLSIKKNLSRRERGGGGKKKGSAKKPGGGGSGADRGMPMH